MKAGILTDKDNDGTYEDIKHHLRSLLIRYGQNLADLLNIDF